MYEQTIIKMINEIELAVYKFNYWLERSSLTSRFLKMLTESVDLTLSLMPFQSQFAPV